MTPDMLALREWATVTVSWLLTYALHSTLLIALVWCITRVIPRHTITLQDALWKIALVGAIVTTSWQAGSGVGSLAKQFEVYELSSAQGTVGGLGTLEARSCDTCIESVNPGQTESSARRNALRSKRSTAISRATTTPLGAGAPGPRVEVSQAATRVGADISPTADRRQASRAVRGTIHDRSSTRVSADPDGVGIDTRSHSTEGTERSQTTHQRPAHAMSFAARIAGASTDATRFATSTIDSAGPWMHSAISWIQGAPASIIGLVRRENVAVVVMAVWLLGCTIGLARFVWSIGRLTTAFGKRREVEDPHLRKIIDNLTQTARLRRRVRLTTSAAIQGPVALGLSEICVPERFIQALARDEQESALAHELAHLVRRDPLWLAAAHLIECVLFFQPLHRIVRREMRDTSEFLCDDWAVQRTGRRLTLARCLAEVAGWLESKPETAPLARMADQRSPLLSRIQRILDEPGRDLAMTSRSRIVVAALLLLIVAAIAPGISAFQPAPDNPSSSTDIELAQIVTPTARVPQPEHLRFMPGTTQRARDIVFATSIGPSHAEPVALRPGHPEPTHRRSIQRRLGAIVIGPDLGAIPDRVPRGWLDGTVDRSTQRRWASRTAHWDDWDEYDDELTTQASDRLAELLEPQLDRIESELEAHIEAAVASALADVRSDLIGGVDASELDADELDDLIEDRVELVTRELRDRMAPDLEDLVEDSLETFEDELESRLFDLMENEARGR